MLPSVCEICTEHTCRCSTRRFLTPVVAVGAVDLSQKLPWSRHYELYGSRRISAMDVMQATGAPVFQGMFDQGRGGQEDATDATVTAAGANHGVGVPNGDGGDRAVSGGGGSAAGGALGVGSGGGGGGSGGGSAVVAGAPARSPGAGGEGKRTAALGDVPAPEVEIAEIMGQEDEGAGVFGAILHEPGELSCLLRALCIELN